ncbi:MULTISPECIES: helix-turn-helix domain-containing protein [unclassified Vibrio]|uniref:helix-turn-helix domain-containing protein n=1 Tax=unclassified Vibrio TaxID=2614977 RepID=UPI00355212D0
MIGHVLKSARMTINTSQQEMANKLNITKQTYMKWENDVTEPKASQVVQLAEILGLSEKEICQGKPNQKISLTTFIHRLNYERPSPEMQVLKLWEYIDDHEEFFESLDPQSEHEHLENEAGERYVYEEMQGRSIKNER